MLRGSLEYIMLSRGVNAAKKESFFALVYSAHIHFILCKWKSSWGVHQGKTDLRIFRFLSYVDDDIYSKALEVSSLQNGLLKYMALL